VRLGCEVRAIEQADDGVRVLTSDGEVHGDAAVVAVPMAVLRSLRFAPPPPAAQAEAWQRSGIAHNAKLHVPLLPPAEPPATQAAPVEASAAHASAVQGSPTHPSADHSWAVPPSAVQSVPGRFWTWTATDGSGAVQPVLHCFGGTPSGLEALRTAEGPSEWAAQAAALRPDLNLDRDNALLTAWNDDPWAGESYSALTVDVLRGDEELIAAPFGRLLFAGEHTAGAWAGLMEGALRSGLRAADEFLALADRLPHAGSSQ
jgi:monoamine oxidase